MNIKKEKICTGCGRSSLTPLGLNPKGDPYLACCPDNNYVDVETQNSKQQTPQEKAISLVDKYIQTNGNSFFAKQCALIAVDEILNSIVSKDDDERLVFELGGNQFYWQEVKTEIEKL